MIVTYFSHSLDKKKLFDLLLKLFIQLIIFYVIPVKELVIKRALIYIKVLQIFLIKKGSLSHFLDLILWVSVCLLLRYKQCTFSFYFLWNPSKGLSSLWNIEADLRDYQPLNACFWESMYIFDLWILNCVCGYMDGFITNFHKDWNASERNKNKSWKMF